MRNQRIIIGVAVGVAALTAAGILMMKQKKSASKKFSDSTDEYGDSFRTKLQSLQRKAKKEFKNRTDEGGEMANAAKERANQWVSKSGANL